MPEQRQPSTGSPVGRMLDALGHEILTDARAALDQEQTDEAVLVHDFRRAMKRWRAFMRMLEDSFENARGLRIEARDLARQLGRARDRQAALEALADLAPCEDLHGTSLDALRNRLEHSARAGPSDVAATIARATLRAYVEEAADTLARWPLDQVAFDTLAAALVSTYRRARRLRPEHWDDASPAELHALRRRVVEHRHQMDLVTPLWPRVGRVWVEEAQRLRGRLGSYQDLVLLQGLCDPQQPLAAWRSHLGPAISRRQAEHTAAAARLAGRLFVERPRDFRRRLHGLWRNAHG